MIGEKITPILIEIENTLWEFEVENGSKPNYPIEAFRAITKIFMSVLMDKMFELQSNEEMRQEDREAMAYKAGEDLRAFVKKYTDVDTHELYK